MTSNIQLQKYVTTHQNRFPNQHFLGVFAANQLPKIVARNCSLIVNYSTSNQAGTHWCAMNHLNSNQPVEFFGSYGLTPDQVYPILHFEREGFEKYMNANSNGLGVKYNSVDLQSWRVGENECGEWAILFLMNGLPNAHNPVWAKFLSITDKIKRDIAVKKYIGIRK